MSRTVIGAELWPRYAVVFGYERRGNEAQWIGRLEYQAPTDEAGQSTGRRIADAIMGPRSAPIHEVRRIDG